MVMLQKASGLTLVRVWVWLRAAVTAPAFSLSGEAPERASSVSRHVSASVLEIPEALHEGTANSKQA